MGTCENLHALGGQQKSSIEWFTQARPNIIQKPNMALKMARDKQISFYRAQTMYKKFGFPAPQAPHSVQEIHELVGSECTRSIGPWQLSEYPVHSAKH